jgi:hypothetical protein
MLDARLKRCIPIGIGDRWSATDRAGRSRRTSTSTRRATPPSWSKSAESSRSFGSIRAPSSRPSRYKRDELRADAVVRFISRYEYTPDLIRDSHAVLKCSSSPAMSSFLRGLRLREGRNTRLKNCRPTRGLSRCRLLSKELGQRELAGLDVLHDTFKLFNRHEHDGTNPQHAVCTAGLRCASRTALRGSPRRHMRSYFVRLL